MGTIYINEKDGPVDGPYPVDLGDDTVDTDEIVDDAVTGAKILDGEVAVADLAATLDLSGKTVTLPSGVITYSADAGATGATVKMYHNSASPAADDSVALLNFHGNNDAAAEKAYGRIEAVIEDPSAGTEAGILGFYAGKGGAFNDDPEFGVATEGVSVTRTDDGAAGPGLELFHESASPAALDTVGRITFSGNDDGDNFTEYASISGVLLNPADGAEAGGLYFSAADGAGGNPTIMSLNGTTAALNMTRTDNGAEGATVQLSHDSASPATDDEVGYIKGIGKDDGGNNQEYAQVALGIVDPADGAEAGFIDLRVANGSGTVESSAIVDNFGFWAEKALFLMTEEITATSETVAASLETVVTAITTNGDSDLDNVSLADGEDNGQIKKFVVSAVGNAADSVKITPAKMIGGTQITFAANPLGLGCEMVWNAAADGWVVVSNNGGTIA